MFFFVFSLSSFTLLWKKEGRRGQLLLAVSSLSVQNPVRFGIVGVLARVVFLFSFSGTRHFTFDLLY